MKLKLVLPLLFLIYIMSGSVVSSLEPDEILILANRNYKNSQSIAKFYMKKRSVPKENLLQLWLTDSETCSFYAYEKNVVKPVLEYLSKNSRIRCILTVYGVPLKISPPEYSKKERAELESLELERSVLKKKTEISGEYDNADLKKKLKEIEGRISAYKVSLDRASSLDSELMLVKKKDYSRASWLPNPYFVSNAQKVLSVNREDVIMVSRLDGSSPEVVKRVILDSLMAEEYGLQGTAYFDARWESVKESPLSAYRRYDLSIHKAAEDIKKSGQLPIVLNSTEFLFSKGECPDAALYCGWYSLANYIDSFTWKKGAVGYHIASAECVTLKDKRKNTWCMKMLDKGISATIGPVGEPYVQAFPPPDTFFKYLTEGYFSLAECYLISIPHVSWKMVLIGDPLYRPFK